MAINRRDVLRFAAGSGVGAVLTPVPWKLLDDSAIWTQNWSLTPKLPRGEVSAKFTTCTLCPAGCGVKANCVNGVPFSLAGVAEHPQGKGKLCAAGVGGHHIAYRKDRVPPIGAGAALARLRSARGTLAVLDMRPGRVVSEAWRAFAGQVKGAVYLAPQIRDGRGFDIEHTRTILSFGVPVLDGWAAPGRVWAARGGFRLIQADSVNSRTAMLADSFLPIKPGGEAALALAIANAIAPEQASAITGLPAGVIAATAREFTTGTPSIALGEGPAIAALNALAGARVPEASGADIATLADGSLGALVIVAADAAETVSWPQIKAKLAQGAVVVAHAAFQTGLARHADIVVPAPAYLESLDEAPGFAVSPALLPKPSQTLDSAEFLAQLAQAFGVAAPGGTEEILKAKAASLHASKKGSVFSYAAGAAKPVTEFKSADEMWAAFAEGACYVDGQGPAAAKATVPGNLPVEGLKPSAEYPLALVARSWTGGTGEAALAPLMTKLYQESRLREEEIVVNPETAARCGVRHGDVASIETPAGSATGRVRVAAGALPGTVEAAIAPRSAALADICAPGGATAARIRRTS